MADYYNEISESYEELHGAEQTKKLQAIKKSWNPKGLILDIGCGTNIANKFFKNTIGLDSSFKMLKKGINVCGEAEKLPFKNNSFDAILCLTAFHNFKSQKKAMSEMKRVLKKDQIAITLLKKSKNFNGLKSLVTKNFNVRCIDEEKDLILICP